MIKIYHGGTENREEDVVMNREAALSSAILRVLRASVVN
jgi:hypothetical protein